MEIGPLKGREDGLIVADMSHLADIKPSDINTVVRALSPC